MPLLPVLVLALAPSSQDAGTPPPPPGADEPRGLRVSTPAAFQGYTLLAPLASKHTYLVDMEGREVHRWTSAHGPSSVYLLDDGSILRHARIEENPVFSGGGICGRIERIGWDGALLWSFELANEDQTTHHDAHPLPNGNVLVIAWEYRYREDCIAAGRDPAHTLDKGLWPDALLEVKPTGAEGGEIVWEWHAWDHLVQDFDAQADDYGPVADRPGRLDLNYDHRAEVALTPEELREQEELEAQMRALGYSGGGDDEGEGEDEPADASGAAPTALQPFAGPGSDWMHTNAVDYHPGLDLIALSSPEMCEVLVIDHSTTSDQAAGSTGGRYGKGGDVLWRWGNPRNYGAGTKEDQRLFYQHNVQWIGPGLPGAGHLLVFNNGRGRPDGDYSSVDELELPLEPGKGFRRDGRAPYGPKEPVWRYVDRERFSAPFISGCQRLANGNTLVCEGPKGRVFEVTAGGEVVWELWSPFGGDLETEGVQGNALFRATRIGPDHPALAGRTLVARDPAPADEPK